jgi:hypothetical protein
MVLAGVLIAALLAVTVWLLLRRRQQSRGLQKRFGSEYGRTVDRLGSRAKGESELRSREKRVGEFEIKPLTPADATRFTLAWSQLQSRFIDNPKGVVGGADQLVRELMLKRGYPVGDFETRAADISVDHPGIVETYRAAQAIAVRDTRGEADTEELRKAVVHYRTLFDELLEVRVPGPEVLPAKTAAVHA